MAAPQTPNAFPDFTNVLVLVGLPAGPVNRALSRHAIDSSPDGVMVNVFDDVARLPRYNEALATHGTPDAVVALRMAATEADAVLVVTSYRGRVPSMAHTAIDWLTRRWRHGALHDKPLAVVGRSSECYSGVWSHQVEDNRGGLGPPSDRATDSADSARSGQEARRRSARRRRCCSDFLLTITRCAKRSDPLCVKEKRDALDGVHDATKPCATLFGTTMTPTADPFHHRYVNGKSMSATASAYA